MTLIDQGGKRVRLVCDKCHRIRVKIRRGSVCEDCRYEEWLRQKRAEARFMGAPIPRRKRRQA